MTPEELQPIIDKFNEDELKQQAIFGVFQYGGGADESYIRANKEGLELFALQLLKSSLKTEEILADKNKTIIPLDYEEDWVEESSDTLLQYIEPIAEKQSAKPVHNQKAL